MQQHDSLLTSDTSLQSHFPLLTVLYTVKVQAMEGLITLQNYVVDKNGVKIQSHWHDDDPKKNLIPVGLNSVPPFWKRSLEKLSLDPAVNT